MLRTKLLRCRRTEACKATVGSCTAGERNWTLTPARFWEHQVTSRLRAFEGDPDGEVFKERKGIAEALKAIQK